MTYNTMTKTIYIEG